MTVKATAAERTDTGHGVRVSNMEIVRMKLPIPAPIMFAINGCHVAAVLFDENFLCSGIRDPGADMGRVRVGMVKLVLRSPTRYRKRTVSTFVRCE